MVRLHTRLNMLAAKDSKPATSGERETTASENEKSSATSTPQPSGLGELVVAATAPTGRGQGAVQRVQVGSTPGAGKSVATMQKQLKEAFEVARRLAYEEATKQRRYYDRRAGAVTLQPGDVVMVRTDGFVGKRKVKDRWEDGGFIVESQLGDWPVYKVRCPSADDRQKPKYRILHRNRLLLVANEDVDDASGHAQAKATPTLPNATHEALSVGVSSQEPLPSLVTRQGGELTSMVWLNGKFRTKPWTQVVSPAKPSPPDLHVDEVSGDESTEPEGT